LGVGVLSAAFKKGLLDDEAYQALIETTTRLNTPGPLIAAVHGVHAMTDITGFGLAGHLLEICEGSRLQARVDLSALPFIEAARMHAGMGIKTGASARNLLSYGEKLVLPEDTPDGLRVMITDPQTSGGLLVSCAPEAVGEVLSIFQAQGFDRACVMGSLAEGEPRCVGYFGA
jgi:selenide,water dikinase